MKFPCLECSENSISQKREQVLLKIHLYCIPESGTPRTMRLGAEGTVPSPGRGWGGGGLVQEETRSQLGPHPA